MTGLTERSASQLAGAIRRREVSATQVVPAHIDRHRAVAPRINAIVADRFAAALRGGRRRPTSGSPPPRPRTRCRRCSGCLSPSRSRSRWPACPSPPGSWPGAATAARRAPRHRVAAPDRRRRDPAGRDQHLRAVVVDRVVQPRCTGPRATPTTPPRAAGGSSGGEGAAVGSGGSPFGVGSDIGGSIRVPAFFCGVFGHKPSPGLVPNTDHYPADLGRGRVDARHRTADAARRGPDAAAVDHGGSRRRGSAGQAGHAREPRGGVVGGAAGGHRRGGDAVPDDAGAARRPGAGGRSARCRRRPDRPASRCAPGAGRRSRSWRRFRPAPGRRSWACWRRRERRRRRCAH